MGYEIYVVDDIMGSGKTSAMINMIKPGRRRRGERYIYITPYLDEVKRVKSECGFCEPKVIGTKTMGLRELLRKRKCIVTTHALFSLIDKETLKLIVDGNYRLIMDEAINPIEEAEFTKDDMELAKKGKCMAIRDDGVLEWLKPRYKGELEYMKKLCEEGWLIGQPVDNFWECGVMWQIPPEVFKSFYTIHILTYRFEGQILKYYFDAYGFEYKYLYVHNTMRGYELTDVKQYRPHAKYGELIHVVGDEELNSLGAKTTALSKGWYEYPSNALRAKKAIRSWLRSAAYLEANRVLWTTFAKLREPFTAYAPRRGFLACNARATNKYAGRDVLAYMLNRYPHVQTKIHFRRRGVIIDDDEFALSEMLQWIFRSAVRNGEEIWIYIPSRRMRSLLLSWIKEVDGDA